MEFYWDLSVTPVPEPIQFIAQDFPSVNEYFSIHLSYTNSTFSSMSNATNPSITFVSDYFLIPIDILCNCDAHTVMDDDDHTTLFLHNTFRFVPTYVLDTALYHMGHCARNMVALNTEERGILEMNVLLNVTTYMVEEDQFDQYPNSNGQQIVYNLEKLEVDFPILDSIDKCSICLEEFCKGSQLELYYTKCSHVFHKDCIDKWIHRCISSSSSCSCPLCRCEII